MENYKVGQSVAALTAALLASVSLAATANAAPAEPRLMPTETEGSLTIHKYDGDPTGGNNSGVELTGDDIPDLDPLDNAGFSVWHLTCPVTDGGTTTEALDLTTNQGWELTSQIFQEVGSNPTQAALTAAADTVTGSTACALDQFGSEQLTGATPNASGVTVFNNMPLGVYYVSETTTPDGFKSALPFLVTVPMTNPDDTSEWMYDINVYPKNRPEATKTVDDAAVNSTEVGDLVSWTITSPAPSNSDSTTGFYMVDTLDPRLTFASSTSVSINQPDGTVIDPALVRGTDYNIYVYDVAADGDTLAHQQIFMELTPTGLAALDNIVATNPNAYVNWNFTTTVTGTGPIENDATIFDNNPSGGQTGTPCTDEPCTPTPPTTPPPTVPECEPEDPTCSVTPPATTKFGAVKITKIANTTDGDDNDVLLAGAEFKILASSSDNACTDGVETGLSGTTDANGELYLQQLRVSDWANGAQLTITDDDDGDPVVPEGWMYYCLVETKAPAGYELLPEGIPFQLITGGNNANTDVIVDDSTDPNVTYQFALAETVENVPSKGGFQLPLTGGIGTLILLVIGAGVLSVTFAYARKQNQKEQAA